MANNVNLTEEQKNKVIKVIVGIKSAMIFFMCFIAFMIGTVFIIQGIPKKRYSEEVKAVVVANEKYESHQKSKKNKDSKACAPVFSYEYNGKEYNVTGSSYKYPPEYEVGDKVTIKIDPDDPEKISVPADKKNVIIGIIMDACAIGAVIFTIRRNRKLKAQLSEAIDEAMVEYNKEANEEAYNEQLYNKEYYDSDHDSYNDDRYYSDDRYYNDSEYYDDNYNDDERDY